MEKNLTSIIILNYNGKLFLKNCIESIMKNTPEKHEIIILFSEIVLPALIFNLHYFEKCDFGIGVLNRYPSTKFKVAPLMLIPRF